MIKRLKIENFQLIRSLDLGLDAVTAIIGESEVGKSCGFRGLEAAINNPRGSKFIRKGASQCLVYIETDAGSVEWTKQREGSASYRVTKGGVTEVFSKVEACPKMAKEVLGIQECQFGDDVYKVVNLAGQFEPPFLIFDTGSKVAKVAGKFTRLDEIYAAVRVANKDLQSLKHDEQTRRRDLELAKDKLSKHQGIEKLEPILGALEKKAAGLDGEKEGLDKMLGGVDRAKALKARIGALQVDPALRDSIQGWQDSTFRDRISEVGRLVSFSSKIRSLRNSQDALQVGASVRKDIEGWGDTDYRTKVAELDRLGKEYLSGCRIVTQRRDCEEKAKVAAENFRILKGRMDEFRDENKLCPACGKSW